MPEARQSPSLGTLVTSTQTSHIVVKIIVIVISLFIMKTNEFLEC